REHQLWKAGIALTVLEADDSGALVPTGGIRLGTGGGGNRCARARGGKNSAREPMNFARTASLAIVIAAAGATWAATRAGAQDGVDSSSPVVKNAVERRERELDEQREARRKTYGPTVYPKHMDGGERPNIAPQKPPVVYLDNNEPPGTIIINTG